METDQNCKVEDPGAAVQVVRSAPRGRLRSATYLTASRPGAQIPRRRAMLADVAVGERVREIRQLRGISQAALGKAVGVTFQQIHKYEVGTSRMAVSTLLTITKALRINPALLLDDGVSGASSGGRLPLAEQVAVLEAYEGLGDPSLRRQALEILSALGRLRQGRDAVA